MSRRRREGTIRISTVLIVIGLLFLILAVGGAAYPAAIVDFKTPLGEIRVEGIPALSAICAFIGLCLIIIGVLARLRGC